MSDTRVQEKAMNMSNEQAVQILIPMRNMMCDQYGCPISDAVFALDKAIEALSADRPKNDWIPVSKRWPSDDEYVIVSVLDDHGDTPWKYTTVAWRCNGAWISDNEILWGTAVAWMPLPKPYREENEE